MSAIFGFLRLDGSDAGRRELEAMDRALAHCGPDGSGLWTDGPVALGHRRLEATPESVGDEQPRGGGESIVTTADAILDNRAELIADLDLVEDGRSLSDSALTREAYRRWREECPKHLLGDFAFVVWDRETGTLFAARDHMGIRPFYYTYLPGRLFAFATELKGLLALADVPRRVDETTVADFLTRNHSSRRRTFFLDIERLDAAHSLTVSARGLKLQPYWSLRPDRRIELPSRQAYAQALRERIEQAVECRLRSSNGVGSHLSGGLDSSALAVLAARSLRAVGRRLVTASFMPAEEEGWRFRDERPYVEAVEEQEPDIEIHEIVTEGREVLAGDSGNEVDVDRPIVLTAATPEGRAAALMAERGARVVLSGWGGDELTTFNGRGYYSELFIKGRWRTLLREAVRRRHNYPFRWYRFLFGQVLGYLLPYRLFDWASAAFGGPGSGRRSRQVINHEFAREVGVEKRMRRHGISLGPNLKRNQLTLISHGHIQNRTESWALFGARHGLAYRFPLLDVRVVEFCLAVPAEQFVHDGWTRYLYRMAMEGVLPEKIRWRPDKLAPLPDGARRLARSKEKLLERLSAIEEDPAVGRYLDLPLIRRKLEMLPDEATLRARSKREFETGGQLHLLQAVGVGQGMALAEYLHRAGLVEGGATPPKCRLSSEDR